jgi:hypothetical protein
MELALKSGERGKKEDSFFLWRRKCMGMMEWNVNSSAFSMQSRFTIDKQMYQFADFRLHVRMLMGLVIAQAGGLTRNADVITRMIFCCSTDDQRPVLCC